MWLYHLVPATRWHNETSYWFQTYSANVDYGYLKYVRNVRQLLQNLYSHKDDVYPVRFTFHSTVVNVKPSYLSAVLLLSASTVAVNVSSYLVERRGKWNDIIPKTEKTNQVGLENWKQVLAGNLWVKLNMTVGIILIISDVELEMDGCFAREPDVELFHGQVWEVSGDDDLFRNRERYPFHTARHCQCKELIYFRRLNEDFIGIFIIYGLRHKYN